LRKNRDKKNLNIVKGKACHASSPNRGENAIEKALAENKNISYMFSSEAEGPNTTPSKAYFIKKCREHDNIACKANIDIRTNLSASNNNSLVDEVISLINDRVSVTVRDKGLAFKINNRKIIDICKNSVDFEVEECVAQGGSDAPYLLELTSSVVPGFGPGDLILTHSDNEYISLEAIDSTPPVIRKIIENFITS